MTFTKHATTRFTPARKSPLRASQLAPAASSPPSSRYIPPRREGLSVPDLRRAMISEYGLWLAGRTNKHHRPFQPDTILAYTETARVLNRWLTQQDIDGDFTACDTALLNQLFADYITTHGQGGTNTRQRTLRHLFTWLEDTHPHPHPHTDKLHRHSPVQVHPSTLAHQFIHDLPVITGTGHAPSFQDTRDHARIHMLTEGVRRAELTQQQRGDLSADLIAQPFVQVIPLKRARVSAEGRIVPLAGVTSRAVRAAWLTFTVLSSGCSVRRRSAVFP